MRIKGRILVGILSCIGTFAPALAADRNSPQKVVIEVDFNFLTEAVNRWSSTGAFADQGTIKHSHSETFSPGVGQVATVVDSPQGQEGTFTWTFKKAFQPVPGSYGLYAGSGGWRILSGTGKYEGMTGQGNLTGTLNIVTGALHDTFTGQVSFPDN